MKNILSVLLVLTSLFAVSNTASAQTRTKISNGVYLVNYGGAVYGIENDNTQQCISMSITQEKKSNGSYAYDILCENRYTKGISKAALGTTIGTVLTSLGQTWLTPIAVSVANIIYDDVCNYYKDK